MRILVCIKEVPETESPISLDEASSWIDIADSQYFRMNRFDECAVEEAIRIKESQPETYVDVLTVGPQRARKILTRAVGMGADHGIHILSDCQGYASPFITASWIAQYAADKVYDLIFTGVMSEDAMQGQTGPMLAELMSMPFATSVIIEKLSLDKGSVYVEREIEAGRRECVEIELPAVLTVQTGMNQPRYPTLSKMLRAKKMEFESVNVESLGNAEVREKVILLRYPEKSRESVILEGTLEEKATELLRLLDRKSLLN
jgi:electron transfer flavoprotein beta subunit